MEEILIDITCRFTEAFRAHVSDPPALREAYAVASMYPALLLPPEEGDRFAWRMLGRNAIDLPVDLGPQLSNQIGFFMNPWMCRDLQKEYPTRAAELEEVISFWKENATFVRIRENAPREIHDYLFPRGTALDRENYLRGEDPACPLVPGAGFLSGSYDTRAAGTIPDYPMLCREGLGKLRRRVEDARASNPAGEDFYRAALITLDTVDRCFAAYASMARDRGMEKLASSLESLRNEPPRTYAEGIQLVVFFTGFLRILNYGRLDVALGDLLAADLAAGRLTEDEALAETAALWEYIEYRDLIFDSRVVIGGRGRPNEKNADLFARYAIRATRLRHAVVPVLTLRLTEKQDPEFLTLAIESIGEGCIYPVLYNDDVIVPGLMRSMGLREEDAEQYIPLGCGEMTLTARSIGSPNTTMRFLKMLEAVLHNGRDGADGARIGLETGPLSAFDSYEKLEKAVCDQIEERIRRDIAVDLWNRKRTVGECTLVMLSLLSDDCIARGKGILEGGSRYFGANIEGFGQINLANSLAAIKKYVYEEKRFTLAELTGILDRNFVGAKDVRELLLAAPKFGNNDPFVDEIKIRVERFINDCSRRLGTEAGLSYCTVASVNPGGITIGPRVAASADGRRCATPMTLGNSPSPGTDKSGLTAMLLSTAKSGADNGGYVTNMNVSRELVRTKPELFRSALESYFAAGGQQLNINCFSRGDLEKALEHPEEYDSLIVRVSGYSARFTSLDSVTQREIMNRTLY